MIRNSFFIIKNKKTNKRSFFWFALIVEIWYNSVVHKGNVIFAKKKHLQIEQTLYVYVVGATYTDTKQYRQPIKGKLYGTGERLIYTLVL